MPSSLILPENSYTFLGKNLIRALDRLVLPQPDSPIIAKVSLSLKVKLTSSTALTIPAKVL